MIMVPSLQDILKILNNQTLQTIKVVLQKLAGLIHGGSHLPQEVCDRTSDSKTGTEHQLHPLLRRDNTISTIKRRISDIV